MAKKKDKFFNYLMGISLNLKGSTIYFADYKLKTVSDLEIFSEKMKEFESSGDTMVHDLISELNNAFITPIEREDILALSISLDDILDGLYHTAALFEMYSMIELDDYILKFVEAIKNCVTEIDTAIKLLSTKNWLHLREHAIKIKEIESDCDNILREAIKHLFTAQKDPIRIIKNKQIYEGLEEIANCSKAVANTFETIIMKNA
ncbi:DUF47 domain-containing protein [Neobacillus drentensis]|uniref:DUF47 domain-containing protein n=1 Tax=Neobacillus drentensis TaxID=220684 RepID=UPI002866892A|nr:DUF47 domain-containing protein [Neobacillus drentensis]MDR7238733.1 putative phosphate transport protein (TIGR00153 family) [Neobacillus drentensis]